MDNVKIENVKKALTHFSLFFEILNSHINDFNKEQTEEKLEVITDLMAQQHTSNKMTLEDLGYTFDDTGKIRALNTKIRELERKAGEDADLNIEIISQFISNLKSDTRTHFEKKYGLSMHPEIKVSDSVSITLKYIKACMPKKDSGFDYYRNDEEREEKIQYCKENHETAKEHLTFNKSGDIYFNDENIAYIENCIWEYFSPMGDVINTSHNLTHYKHDKDETMQFQIQGISFDLISLQSHKAIASMFS